MAERERRWIIPPRIGVTIIPATWIHARVLCIVVVLTSLRRIKGGGERIASSPVAEYK